MSATKFETVLSRPCLKVYSRIIFRMIERQQKNADSIFRKAGLSVDRLWEADEGDNWWTYSDWFRTIRIGYREVGPMMPVLMTEGFSHSCIPLMEEIVASAPNYSTTLDMWESWQQELEPLVNIEQKKRTGRHLVVVDYAMRGKVLEAFALGAAAIVCSMYWSHLGRHGDFHVTTGFPDTHGTFESWSELWVTKMTHDPKQKPALVFHFSESDMKERNVGHHPLRFAVARERYFDILKSVVEFAQTPSLLDFAAAIMKTSRKQFTRQTIADEIGCTEKQYSNALAKVGLTHRVFVDGVQMERVRELQELGYSESKVLSALGINDSRKLQRLIDRVSQ